MTYKYIFAMQATPHETNIYCDKLLSEVRSFIFQTYFYYI